MNESDVPPPSDMKIGVALYNCLMALATQLATNNDLLKQIAANTAQTAINTTPKKAP